MTKHQRKKLQSLRKKSNPDHTSGGSKPETSLGGAARGKDRESKRVIKIGQGSHNLFRMPPSNVIVPCLMCVAYPLFIVPNFSDYIPCLIVNKGLLIVPVLLVNPPLDKKGVEAGKEDQDTDSVLMAAVS